jgi:3-oxoacyl-[acyl-carrier protein] reductase
MKDLSGKYAVVTGAQKGIGYAIAKRFLAENVEGIALLDIDSIDTFTLDPAGTRAFSYICDVSDCENVKEVFEQIYFRFGRIDILVNNAGIIADAMFHKMTEVQWKKVMQVNIDGLYNCTRQVIQNMREQQYGKIINLASTSAFGAVGQCNYALTKSGIIGFTKSLAKESARKCITVNAVAPDFIDTEMMRSIPHDKYEALCREAPMQRPGTPDEVAALVTYLASDDSSYVNGECIVCSGVYST